MAAWAPDRAHWPEGRLGRIRVGELSGCYCLVSPELEDRWIVYVSDDPDLVPRARARFTDWGFSDTPSLQVALDDVGVEWLDPSEDAVEEARVFDLRREWRRRRRWWWRRRL